MALALFNFPRLSELVCPPISRLSQVRSLAVLYICSCSVHLSSTLLATTSSVSDIDNFSIEWYSHFGSWDSQLCDFGNCSTLPHPLMEMSLKHLFWQFVLQWHISQLVRMFVWLWNKKQFLSDALAGSVPVRVHVFRFVYVVQELERLSETRNLCRSFDL